jgi:hypothetical protein
MKDIVIRVRHQKKECIILSLCFLAVMILNVAAIIGYNTAWKELYTQWYVVIPVTFFLYFLTWMVRLIILAMMKGWKSMAKWKS